MIKTTNPPKFGHRAESWVIDLLIANGNQVVPATEVDDRVHKVDFWLRWRQNQWLAIQFSVNKQAIVNGKGTDALKRGIVPSWLDGQELEEAVNGKPEIQKRLLTQFWKQVESIVAACPELPVRRPAVTALQSR